MFYDAPENDKCNSGRKEAVRTVDEYRVAPLSIAILFSHFNFSTKPNISFELFACVCSCNNPLFTSINVHTVTTDHFAEQKKRDSAGRARQRERGREEVEKKKKCTIMIVIIEFVTTIMPIVVTVAFPFAFRSLLHLRFFFSSLLLLLLFFFQLSFRCFF